MAVILGSNRDDRDPVLFGGPANDTVRGLAGDDWLSWSGGSDRIDGGSGFDVIFYDSVPLGVIINNTAVARSGVAAFSVLKRGVGTDRLVGIEAVHGSNAGDVIFVGNGTVDDGSYVFDRGGADVVTGGRNGTNFNVGSGRDRFVGQAGVSPVDAFWTLSFFDDGFDAAGPTSRGVSARFTSAFAGTAVDGWGFTDSFSGINRIRGGELNDTLAAGAGEQRLEGRGGRDSLTGGAGRDTLIGGDDADTLRGGADNDRLSGGEGRDTLDGGAGSSDELEYNREGGPRGVRVDLAARTAVDSFGDVDTLIGIERARGTAFADTFIGDGARNRFRGGDGADSFDGGGDIDTVFFEEDAITRGVTVNLAAGRATDSFGAADRLVRIENVTGTRFADTLTGDANDNFFELRGGADVAAGGAGFDVISFYDDNPRRGAVASLVTGVAVDSTGARDRFSGFEGLTGSSLADSLTGDGRGNYLEGRAGADTLTGGAGLDTASYQFDDDDGDMVVDLARGFAIDPSGARDVLRGIEIVRGGGGADRIIGNAVANFFAGTAGADTLNGAGGFDQAFYGRDARTGGSRGVTVDLATGRAVDGFGDTDTLISIEWVSGTAVADRLLGSARADRFTGLGGADRMDGRGGVDTVDYSDEDGTRGVVANLATGVATDSFGARDTLVSIEHLIGGARADRFTGRALADRLDGGGGADVLMGGGGNDRLTGGAARDLLTGGAGRDTFVYLSVTDSRPATAPRAPATADVITDFARGLDRIDLRAIDADTDGTAGNQAFAFIGAARFSGVDGQLRFSAGVLQGDVNGDRTADFTVTLTGVTAMAAGDFVL